MKKYSLSVICVVLFALLAGCGSKETSNITVDYGDSAVYTEQDMDDAIKVIEEMIGSWEGCDYIAFHIRQMTSARMKRTFRG